jgi:hypothetical protein
MQLNPHTEPARTLMDSSEKTPKQNFASQPGRNFGPSKSLRRPNRTEPRRTVSGSGRTGTEGGIEG